MWLEYKWSEFASAAQKSARVFYTHTQTHEHRYEHWANTVKESKMYEMIQNVHNWRRYYALCVRNIITDAI